MNWTQLKLREMITEHAQFHHKGSGGEIGHTLSGLGLLIMSPVESWLH